MAIKTTPYMEVWCYPLIPTKRWRARSFGLSDNLANLDKGPEPRGGYTGFIGTPATGTLSPSVGPGQGGHITETDGLQWFDLWDEEDKTRLAGYTVQPRAVPLSSVLENETKLNPPTTTVGLVWRASGDFSEYWQTVLPDREPLCTGIKFSSVNMLHRAAASTVENLPEGQEFRVELQLLGVDRSTDWGYQPWLKLTWGLSHGVYFAAGQQAVYGQMPPPTGSGAYTSSDLRPLRTLAMLDGFWGYGVVAFDVRYVGGRLVLQSGENGVVYTNRNRNKNPQKSGEQDREGAVDPIRAVAAPLQVEAVGLAFTVRVQEIAYADATIASPTEANPVPGAVNSNKTGYFKRRFYAAQAPGADAKAYVMGYHPAVVAPNGREQSPEKIGVVTIEPGTAAAHDYRCTLTAKVNARDDLETSAWRNDVLTYKAKAMRGQKSPFVHGVVMKQPPSWETVTTADPVNIRPALLRATESCADPLLQAGPAWEFDIDRNVLQDLAHPSGGTLGEDWDDYVNRYHLIAVNTGWVYDDGSIRAWITPSLLGTTRCRLFGYQTSIGPAAPGYGKRELKMSARDPVVRLQRPAGMVNARFAALDFLLANKLATSSLSSQSALYGADAVHYMLQTALGEQYADNLQVYYPGYIGSWPPTGSSRPNQWTLLEYRAYTDPPSGSGFIFPPPFGSPTLEWMQKMGEADFAIFFYGPSWTTPGQLAPCYGNYFVYLYGRDTSRITDAEYIAGDPNLAMSTADWRQVAEHDFNVFTVWGQAPGGGDLGGLMPALPQFSAESIIEGSALPEQDVSKTWERTKLLQGTQFWLPGVARIVAFLAREMVRGLQVRRVSLRVRGLEWLWWGDKVQVTASGAQSDPQFAFAPGGTPQTFRVMRIQNTYDLQGGNWEGVLSLADQPNWGSIGNPNNWQFRSR